MLTTVAVLVIVLGLMVSLARDVRTRSAERLTKDLLARLDTLVEQYRRPLRTLPEEQRKIYPAVHPLVDAGDRQRRDRSCATTRRRTTASSSARSRARWTSPAGSFSDLSIANYNEVNVLDAWGSPIVYMPSQHPLIGMAAGDRSFFFSAGPDRRYLTRQDNLYSYEAGPSP